MSVHYIFEISERLSKNSFLVKYSNPRYPWVTQAVAKIIKRELINEFENERDNLRRINSLSPSTVKLYDSIQQENQFVLFMEHCEKGDLSRNWEILQNEEIRLDFFYKMLKAVKVFHKNRILHRDLKPQNIFVTKDNEFKIGDFGSSKLMKNIQMESLVGTKNYMSPAQIKNIEYLKFPTDPCANDVWSLGIIFLEACSGSPITETLISKDKTNDTNAKKVNETIDQLRAASLEIKKLLKKMLTIDENRRITVQKALKIVTKLKFHSKDLQQ